MDTATKETSDLYNGPKGKYIATKRHRHEKNNKQKNRVWSGQATGKQMKRAGIKRTSKGAIRLTQEWVKSVIDEILQTALLYTQNGRRKTVTVSDIAFAAKRVFNFTLYE